MTENNLDNLFGEESESGGESAGGEGVTLDADLAGMLDESGAAGGSEGGGEEAGAGLDMGGLGGGEAGAGESAGEGLDLGGLLGGEEGGGGEAAADKPKAPAPAAAGGGGVSAQAEGLAHSRQTLSKREAVNLDFLLDVKLDVTFEVGRSKMLISDLLTLGQGSVVELHRLVGEELDLLVNGKLFAKGEVVVVNEKFGCKISMIVSPEERIRHLGAV
jgi:flagellar motor switch protein FliN/FliY